MRVLQTIYTSCIKGQSGSSGFQFYSHSGGLSGDELLEIEKLGNYIAPMGLPSCPSKEEIAELFPVSFSYFRLKSGRFGALQSVALAQDYSGRPGNFIAHAFVMESGPFPFAPVYLYRSESFRTDLTGAEWNTAEVPEKLPAADAGNLILNAEITIDNVRGFLEENDSEGVLRKLINAVIENAESRRGIVLVADSREAARWIAALSFAFPAGLLQNLTFSTYTVDPSRTNFLAAATSPKGSRFDPSNEMAFKHQFYVFDLGARRVSAMERDYLYPNIAETAIKVSYGKFEKFKAFFDSYDYDVINRDIDTVYKLFAARDDKNASPDSLLEFADFTRKYAKPEAMKSFLADYRDYLEKSVTNISLDAQEMEKFFSAVAEIAEKAQSADSLEKIFGVYARWASYVIYENEEKLSDETHFQKVLEINGLVAKILHERQSGFSSMFFDEKSLNDMYTPLSDSRDGKFAACTLAIAIQNARVCGYDVRKLLNNSQSVKAIKGKLRGAADLKECLPLLLSSAADGGAETFVTVLSDLSAPAEDKLPPAYMPDLLTRRNFVNPKELHDGIRTIKNLELLVDLMPYFLKNTDDSGKGSLFWDDIELSTQPEYQESLTGSYVQAIKGNPQPAEMLKLIRFSDKHKYTRYQGEMVELFESCVDPKKDDFEADDLKLIASIKEKSGGNAGGGKIELMLLKQKITDKSISLPNAFDELKKKFKPAVLDSPYIAPVLKAVFRRISNAQGSMDYGHVFPFLMENRGLRQKFMDELIMYHKFQIMAEKNKTESYVIYKLADYTIFLEDNPNKSEVKVSDVTDFTAGVLSGIDRKHLKFLEKRYAGSGKGERWEKLMEKAAAIRGGGSFVGGVVDGIKGIFFKSDKGGSRV